MIILPAADANRHRKRADGMFPLLNTMKLIHSTPTALSLLACAGATSLFADTYPAGKDAVPAGQGDAPAGQDAVPAGAGDAPAGQDAEPIGQESVPAGKDAQPLQPVRRSPADTAADPEAELTEGVFADRWEEAHARLVDAASERTEKSMIHDQLEATKAWAEAALKDAETTRPDDLFTSQWWADVEQPMAYSKTRPASDWWGSLTWGELTNELGRGAVAPFAYLPGLNLKMADEMVTLYGQAVATMNDYRWSADELADAEPEPLVGRDPAWFPLGTYVLSPDTGEHRGPQAVQLALEKSGTISGTYTNWPQGRVHPIRGNVDQETWRATFRVDGNTQVVVDTGLYNLGLPRTKVLVHLPNGETESWLMIRLDDPSAERTE